MHRPSFDVWMRGTVSPAAAEAGRGPSDRGYDAQVRRLALGLSLAIGLASLVPPLAAAAASPCRVRNVDQGTAGGSLKAMAAAADDGDRLRVRGVCRGEVVVASDITIRGVGEGPAVTGLGVRRVLRVQPGAEVTIRDLLIRDGRAPDAVTLRGGGGIRIRGSLTLIDSTVRDNRAGPGGLGGGILNLGDLTVSGSTIRRNRASRGGGIDSRRLDAGDLLPQLAIGDSRIIRNRAEVGGGIHNMGVATMDSSLVARDRAGFGGAGIANVQTGDFDIDDSTIRDNVAGTEGGGIANYDGATLTLGTVAFSGNSPDDCIGSPAC
jgi:hypothetical protein